MSEVVVKTTILTLERDGVVSEVRIISEEGMPDFLPELLLMLGNRGYSVTERRVVFVQGRNRP